VIKFQSVKRIPNCEIGPWPETLQRWYGEGMAMSLSSSSCWGGQPYFGLEPLYLCADVINKGPLPPFEEKVFEETDKYIVKRYANGIVRKSLKMSKSMDQYLDFPVKNRADFEALKERFNPDNPARYQGALLKDCNTRTIPLASPGSVGLYMKLREWMGTENLSIAFHEQPDLIHDMLDFIVDFHLRIVDRVGDALQADLFTFGEDLAYKNGPLLSPRMFAEFFAPRYKRITSHLRKRGIDIFLLESDGNFEILLPQLIECGITANIPVEVAAGMDVVKLRKKYGKDMAWIGGIDKRCISAGKEAIRRELETKLPYLVESNGCIPMIDGDLATDISLENFQYYLELKSSYLWQGIGFNLGG
jgi:uroporphyrinogen decarboxylase